MPLCCILEIQGRVREGSWDTDSAQQVPPGIKKKGLGIKKKGLAIKKTSSLPPLGIKKTTSYPPQVPPLGIQNKGFPPSGN